MRCDLSVLCLLGYEIYENLPPHEKKKVNNNGLYESTDGVELARAIQKCKPIDKFEQWDQSKDKFQQYKEWEQRVNK